MFSIACAMFSSAQVAPERACARLSHSEYVEVQQRTEHGSSHTKIDVDVDVTQRDPHYIFEYRS